MGEFLINFVLFLIATYLVLGLLATSYFIYLVVNLMINCPTKRKNNG